jgi:hypothetical protein
LIGDVEATKLGNCNHPIIFLMRFRDKYKVQSFDIKYGSKLLTTKTLYVKKGELKTNPVILINFIIKAVEDAMKHLPEAVALLDPAKVSSVQAAHEDVQQTEQEGAGDENYALNSANEITESVLASKHLSHLHVKHHGNDDNKQSVDELTTKAVDTFVAVSEAGKIDPQVSE